MLGRLDELGLTDDTLVYFASDHGAHIELGAEGGSNRPFREEKEGEAGKGRKAGQSF